MGQRENRAGQEGKNASVLCEGSRKESWGAQLSVQFNKKCLLMVCYVSGPVLGAGDVANHDRALP